MLIDKFQRKIDYVRISVTDRCNFRCLYCNPNSPFKFASHNDILSFEDMFEFVKILIDNGVTKVRITGGEPLARKGVENFVKMINSYSPDIDLAMTTNGYFLPKMCEILAKNGLKRVNISLDTLNQQKFFQITKFDGLNQVLEGIEMALKCGLKVKLNSVCIKNINDDEILDLFNFAKNLNVEIRFIEFMENKYAKNSLTGVKSDEILKKISNHFEFEEIFKKSQSPARNFILKDGYKFGIIDPHRHDFCDVCNKIRISAKGVILPCLFYEEGKSIKEAIKSKNFALAKQILDEILSQKPEKNMWGDDKISDRAFFYTGG